MKNFLIVVLILILVGCFFVANVPSVDSKNFGVTFSVTMADYLDIDWQEAYIAILEDLNIKKLRIPVYWPEVEPEEGQFDFSRIDWMMEKAVEHKAELILVVGRRVPRWPECHSPEWVQSEEMESQNKKLLNYIEVAVKRYDNNPTVWAWQVENEPFLKFGICPKLDVDFFESEIALVKSLSDKPIVLTDGGEFGDWVRAYKRADVFGSTMYRHVVTRYIGEWTYPIPSWFFRLKQGLVEVFYGEKPRLVVELQAEPWIDGDIKTSGVERQYEGFGPERHKKMTEYIKGTGFDTFYFWGAEWWYWLKTEKESPEMWELVKEQTEE